jgi:hypothetical protein
MMSRPSSIETAGIIAPRTARFFYGNDDDNDDDDGDDDGDDDDDDDDGDDDGDDDDESDDNSIPHITC